MSEVVLVGIGSQNTTHRRNIETEQASANGGEGANGVDVVERLKRSADARMVEDDGESAYLHLEETASNSRL
jgi:hypothetical protein